MKVHTVNLKQDNMLCHRCVLDVVKALGYIGKGKVNIEDFNRIGR